VLGCLSLLDVLEEGWTVEGGCGVEERKFEEEEKEGALNTTTESIQFHSARLNPTRVPSTGKNRCHTAA